MAKMYPEDGMRKCKDIFSQVLSCPSMVFRTYGVNEDRREKDFIRVFERGNLIKLSTLNNCFNPEGVYKLSPY